MSFGSRILPSLCSLAAALLLVLSTAAVAEYPEKPIRFIIPSAAGGSPDVLMRILTAELTKRLGVAFVVINKPGANAIIGTMEIVSAAPDGYTLGYGNIVSLAIVYGLMSRVPSGASADSSATGRPVISVCVSQRLERGDVVEILRPPCDALERDEVVDAKDRGA